MEFAVLYLILILLITYNVYRYTEHESLKTQMLLLLDYKKDIESQLNLLNTDLEQMTKLQTQRNQQQYSDISEILNQAFTPSIYPNPNLGTRQVPNFVVQTQIPSEVPLTPMSSPIVSPMAPSMASPEQVPIPAQINIPEIPQIPKESPKDKKISFNTLSGA